MVDRPIIFSAPMVRALLDGRKTQTRRVLNPPPLMTKPTIFGTILLGQRRVAYQEAGAVGEGFLDLPYAPGDQLWVREAWRIRRILDPFPGAAIPEDEHLPIWYEADREGPDYGRRIDFGRYRNGRFMPRWASRLTLTVTEVRVQRLQDISEADAMAEGADYAANNMGFSPISGQPIGVRTFKAGFAHLWNSLHGPDAWDANPWVVAVSFTVQRGKIDQIGGAA